MLAEHFSLNIIQLNILVEKQVSTSIHLVENKYSQSTLAEHFSLNIIQLNILVEKQINMAKSFYDEISKYSQSMLANISRIKQLKMHPKF